MNQTKANLKRSNAHEASIEIRLRGIYGGDRVRRQPGSGNQATKPNDVLVKGEMYVECKETSKHSISLKYSWLQRLREASLLGALRGILAVRFSNEIERDFFVVEDELLYHLLQCEVELNELLGKRRAAE